MVRADPSVASPAVPVSQEKAKKKARKAVLQPSMERYWKSLGPDCGASDPGAPSGLPDDLNGILPELVSAGFQKSHLNGPASMPFKWSDAI